jgi:hypothetical protein
MKRGWLSGRRALVALKVACNDIVVDVLDRRVVRKGSGYSRRRRSLVRIVERKVGRDILTASYDSLDVGMSQSGRNVQKQRKLGAAQ